MKKQTLTLSVLEQYFTERYSPTCFLDRLHRVIVHYACSSGDSAAYADPATLAEDIEFLDSLHEAVKEAAVPVE